MRHLFLLALLTAVPALADDVEVFVDRGETYLRAGSDAGLQRGMSVDILSGKGGKKIGTAMVMETWAALARVNLDDPARADKAAKKYAAVGAKAASAPPPPPVAPPPPPPPPPPQQPGQLKGRAVYGGAGPWTALQVINESKLDWHDCTVTMLPVNASYRLPFLRAEDHELIGRSNFTNRDFEGDPTSARVVCKEGSADFPIR